MNPSTLFSNQDYYDNKVFKRLWIEYEKIASPEYQNFIYFMKDDPDKILEQSFENFYTILYLESKLWFDTVGRGKDWRKGLE